MAACEECQINMYLIQICIHFVQGAMWLICVGESYTTRVNNSIWNRPQVYSVGLGSRGPPPPFFSFFFLFLSFFSGTMTPKSCQTQGQPQWQPRRPTDVTVTSVDGVHASGSLSFLGVCACFDVFRRFFFFWGGGGQFVLVCVLFFVFVFLFWGEGCINCLQRRI